MQISRTSTFRKRTDRQIARRLGFTLLEVLLVLAILGVIAAMVVPNLIGTQEKAYRNTTKINIQGFEDVVKQYAIDHDGQYPEGNGDTVINLLMSPEADQSTGKQRAPYLEKVPVDAWKNHLRYEFPASGNRQTISGKPAIWSCGPDKQDDSADDVNNWSER